MTFRLSKGLFRFFAKKKKERVFVGRASLQTPKETKPMRVLESSDFADWLGEKEEDVYQTKVDSYRQLDFELSNRRLKKTRKKKLTDDLSSLTKDLHNAKIGDLLLPFCSSSDKTSSIFPKSVLSKESFNPIDEDLFLDKTEKAIKEYIDLVNGVDGANVYKHFERSFGNYITSSIRLVEKAGLDLSIENFSLQKMSLKGTINYMLIDCEINRKKNGIKLNYSEKRLEDDFISIKRRKMRRTVSSYLLSRVIVQLNISCEVELKKQGKTVEKKDINNKEVSLICDVPWNKFDYRAYKRNEGDDNFLNKFSEKMGIKETLITDFENLMKGNSFYKYDKLSF